MIISGEFDLVFGDSLPAYEIDKSKIDMRIMCKDKDIEYFSLSLYVVGEIFELRCEM